jgi:hypothetical protein
MVNKSVWALCSVALLVAAFVLPASAQDAQDRKLVVVHGKVLRDTPNNEVPPPNTTIFSNFGTGTTVWVDAGYQVSGNNTPSDHYPFYVAHPFTPTANSHATKAEVPVQCYGCVIMDGGTAGFEISIQGDCSGVPCGTALPNGGPKQETATTPFFTCCATSDAVSVPFGGGVSLTAGTQYWVVVDTIPAGDTATEDVWAFAGKHQGIYGEDYDNTGWNPANQGPYYALMEPGLRVTGTNP